VGKTIKGNVVSNHFDVTVQHFLRAFLKPQLMANYRIDTNDRIYLAVFECCQPLMRSNLRYYNGVETWIFIPGNAAVLLAYINAA
jgi:hypothetical protein